MNNTVVLWDRIVGRKEDAKMALSTRNKYKFRELSQTFRQVRQPRVDGAVMGNVEQERVSDRVCAQVQCDAVCWVVRVRGGSADEGDGDARCAGCGVVS